MPSRHDEALSLASCFPRRGRIGGGVIGPGRPALLSVDCYLYPFGDGPGLTVHQTLLPFQSLRQLACCSRVAVPR